MSPAVVEGCEIFLRTLFDISSDPSILPREFAVSSKRAVEDELLATWLGAVGVVADRVTPPGTRAQAGLARGLSDKAHLVLFAPVAFKLLSCPHGAIRELAGAMSASVDLGALVSSLTDLLDRTEALDSENERLRAEIHKLTSSQHLSF